MRDEFAQPLFILGFCSGLIAFCLYLWYLASSKKRQRYFRNIESLTRETQRILFSAKSKASDLYATVHAGSFPYENSVAQKLLEDIGEAESRIESILESEDSMVFQEPILISCSKDIIRWTSEVESIAESSDGCPAPS